MANTKVSAFPTATLKSGLLIPALDLSQAAGQQNVKVPSAAFYAAFAAAGSGGGGGGGGGGEPQTVQQTGVVVAGGSSVDLLMFSPATDSNDVLVFSLLFRQGTIAGGNFTYAVYVGNPASNGRAIYDHASRLGGTIIDADYWLPVPVYLPRAAADSNQIYVRVTNAGSSPMTVNLQMVALEFAGNGPVLAGYQEPSPYTGPLLNTVYVGPTRDFIEPRYGMQALADGGTMYIDPGTYYLPFGIASVNDASISDHTSFGPNPNSASGTARFAEGITIIGNGAYGSDATMFDGRGGYGPGPQHPFRLTFGKGFLYARAPVTVQGIQFVGGGGGDHVSDAEAGFYAESFAELGMCHLTKCAFDNNENGVFVPPGEPYAAVLIEDCDFGYRASNGAAGDGLSHDFYIQGPELTVNRSNFYGSSWGNCLKSRSPVMTVNDCYVRHNQGRCIDYPDGGTLTVNRTTLTAAAGAVANFFGYANEHVNINPLANPVFTDCTVIGTRYNDMLWVAGAGVQAQFVNVTQSWYHLGSTPPNFTFSKTNAKEIDLTAVAGLANAPGTGELQFVAPPAPPAPVAA